MRANTQLVGVDANPEGGVEDQQDPFLISPPSSRGKFSYDRETWERIHQQRYQQWQLGDSVEAIAAEHGVTYNAIRHSIQWCETRLRTAEVLAARAMRLRLTTTAALADRYVTELGKLMSDENAFVRLKALEHIRRTAGMEQQGGIHVSTQVNVGSVGSRGRSYEDVLREIKAEKDDARNLEAENK